MEQDTQKGKPSLQDKKIILWLTANATLFYLINDICNKLQLKTDKYILFMGLFMWLIMGPTFLFLTLQLRKATTLNPIIKSLSLAAGWILVISLFIGPVLAYLAIKNYL